LVFTPALVRSFCLKRDSKKMISPKFAIIDSQFMVLIIFGKNQIYSFVMRIRIKLIENSALLQNKTPVSHVK
jgi:hypothetical protein